jgi:starch phosphorylase
MATILPRFNMNRVVHDYASLYYGPAARRGRQLAGDDFAVARGLAAWKNKVKTAWPGVALRLGNSAGNRIEFSESVTLEADVTLNGLAPGDIRLECVVSRELCSELTVPVRQFAERGVADYGQRTLGDVHIFVQPFEAVGAVAEGGIHRYRVELRPPWCGVLHFQVRAVPWHARLSHPYELGLMRWI